MKMNISELIEQFKQYTLKEKSLVLLLLIYPTFAISMKNGSIAIFIVFALWSIFGAKTKWSELSSEEKAFLLAYVVFFLFAVITLFYTEDVRMGRIRVERLLPLPFVPMIYMLFRKQKAGLMGYFIYGIIFASFVMGFVAAYDIHVMAESRAEGSLNATAFGDMAVLNAALLTVALVTVFRKGYEEKIIIAAVLFALYAAIESKARGAWLFVPVFLLMIVMLIWRSREAVFGWKKTSVVLVLLLGMGLAKLPVIIERVGMAAGEIEAYDRELDKSYSSVRARLQMWEASVYIWKKNPLLGVGIGDYSIEKDKLIDELGFANENFERYDHAHSIYFETLAGMGGVGLVLLVLAFVVFPARYLLRYCEYKDTTEKFFIVGGITVIVAFAVFGLTITWIARKNILPLYLIYILIFLVAANQSRRVVT